MGWPVARIRWPVGHQCNIGLQICTSVAVDRVISNQLDKDVETVARGLQILVVCADFDGPCVKILLGDLTQPRQA